MPFSAPQMQRRWKSLPGEPVGDAGDAYTGYDRFGRVERMKWGKLGDGGSFTPLVDVSWGHSPASQKTWRKDLLAPPSTAQDQKFDYDALYQLTQRQRGVLNVNLTSAGGVPAQQEDFAYDETGNWKGYRQQAGGASVIEQSRVNNRSNQITQVDGSSAGISYGKNGNMLTVPTGEALTDPSNRIVWDGWNRPAKVYDSADNLLAEYRYDGLGRRVTVASGGVTRHTYYDDQWRSIEERLDGSTTPERQHVWHPADRWEMILRDRSTANNGVMDERLYPMKDQLDPVAIADDTGNVVERFSYTAFGVPTFLDSSFNPQAPAHAWDFLFHAEFQDADTGWFNYGYRYYAPGMGRWLSRDPIGERGGVNLFGAMLNNLQFYIDILGRDPSPPPPTSTPSPTNPSPAPGAPPFDEKKKAKNCFAYACQDYSKFVGSPLPSNPANGCDAGKAALLQDYKDKIREVPNHQSCKDDEYKIYMFWGIMGDAGPDFHFYRQNADGTYSHQIGNSKPSNTDGGGKPITDPLSASRWNDDWKSDYNKFRGSFCVKKGGCIIKPGSGIY